MSISYKYVAVAIGIFFAVVFAASYVLSAGMWPPIGATIGGKLEVPNDIQKQGVDEVTSTIPCNKAATTSPCDPARAREAQRVTPIQDEKDVPAEYRSSEQEGSIDARARVTNALGAVRVCGKTLRSKQVVIDGVNIAQRIAELSSAYDAAHSLDCSPMSTEYYLTDILRVGDVVTFRSEDQVMLPGNTYRVPFAGGQYLVNLQNQSIFVIGGYDGTVSRLGSLK